MIPEHDEWNNSLCPTVVFAYHLAFSSLLLVLPQTNASQQRKHCNHLVSPRSKSSITGCHGSQVQNSDPHFARSFEPCKPSNFNLASALSIRSFRPLIYIKAWAPAWIAPASIKLASLSRSRATHSTLGIILSRVARTAGSLAGSKAPRSRTDPIFS